MAERRALWPIVLSTLVVAGAVRPRFGGSVTLPLPTTVLALDPTRAGSVAESLLAPLVFEGLYGYDDRGGLVPALAGADPVPSANRRTFRITLRQTRFHDGSPVRAMDVAGSLARTLRVPSSRWLLADLEGAGALSPTGRSLPAGLVVLSDTELELRFQRSVPDVRRLLAAPPAAITAPTSRGDRPLGTGPFRVETLGPAGVQLRANPDHWAGPPFLDRVLATPPRRRNDEVRSFEIGELWMSFHAASVYGGTPRGGSQSLRGRPSQLLAVAPISPLVRDPDARRALDLAIDRNRLERLSITPIAVLPGGRLGRDLGAARAAMARAAARAGIVGRPRLEMSYDDQDAIAVAVTEVLIASLDEIGVDLAPRPRGGAAAGSHEDLRYLSVGPMAPDPTGLVTAALAASSDAARATALMPRQDDRVAEREGAGIRDRGSLLILGLRTPAVHARASLRGLRFDSLGRLDLASTWIEAPPVTRTIR